MANQISGKALAGATMVLSGAASATTTAGPTGSYVFTGLAAGGYTVKPLKPGIAFSPVSQNATIGASDIVLKPFLGTAVGSQGSTYTIQSGVHRVPGFA